MKFLWSLLQRIRRLWNFRSTAKKMKRLVDAGPPTKRDNASIYKTISYADMNIEHYSKMGASYPKEISPPPNVDDSGLN